MTLLSLVSVRGSACWAGGRWVQRVDQLPADGSSEGLLPEQTLSAPRIARADRITRLAAAVSARALCDLPTVAGDRLAVLGGTVLASLQTNEAYERRRLRTGHAPPRDFPYTAPNAWLGEVGAALDARGPSLCLVGDGAVGLMVVEAASRWLDAAMCDRAVVMVAECAPSDPRWLPQGWRGCSDGAAALVLERAEPQTAQTLRIGVEQATETQEVVSSLEVLARVVVGLRSAGRQRFGVTTRAGAGWWVEVDAG